MTNIYELITYEKFQKLKELLGTERLDQYWLQRFEFSVLTDRSDSNLAEYLRDVSSTIDKIVAIIGCKHSDLVFAYDSNGSDHELATHVLDLNNQVRVGCYCKKGSEYVQVTKCTEGVYFYKSLTTQESGGTSKYYLEPLSWDEVFRVRDSVEMTY